MARIYLETSFVSACVTDRQDVASAYRRDESLQWWRSEAARHALFVSAEVLAELSAPGHRRSLEAVEWIRGIPLLPIGPDEVGLAKLFVNERVMPGPVGGDALHVAVACWHRCEHLLSWNVKHLANPNKSKHLAVLCMRMGLPAPSIVTPESLWEGGA
ncbi:MAG: hypothetical protein HZA53_06290 [Planctomycetes bacterium]|nr:hypothetical protein [Planctomycetota bacterium]